jgi:CheY-like chemotaxis protein
MSSFAILCYHCFVTGLVGRRAAWYGFAVGQETMTTGDKEKRILVIGRNTPLMEGVSDLLQVVGYPVEASSTWTETEYAMHDNPPDLVIIDLSIAAPDSYQLAEEIRSIPHWSEVPILLISFSGEDRIRELQRRNQRNGDKKVHFYAHTLLSMDGLLEEVRTCLA